MSNQATTDDRPAWQPEWLDLYPHIDSASGPYAYVSLVKDSPRIVIGGGFSEKGVPGLDEAALLLHTAAELLEDIVEAEEL